MPPNALCRLKVGFWTVTHSLSRWCVIRIWIVRSRVEPWPSHHAKQFTPIMPLSLSLFLFLHVGVYIDTNRLSRKPDLKLG